MTKYIAFLRAINVGGHTVKMDRLRALVEELGFSKVETFIASGNVIFESPAKNPALLEKQIGKHLESSLGYEVDTFLRTMPEVVEIAKRCPFQAGRKNDDVYVAFIHEAPNAAAKSALMALQNRGNEFAVLDREIFWLRLNKDNSIFLKSSLEKIIKVSATVRNMTTIRKLVERFA